LSKTASPSAWAARIQSRQILRNAGEAPAPHKIRLSSKPVKTIVPLLACQLIVYTGFPPVLHKRGARPSAPIQPLASSVYAQQNVIFRLRGPMPNRQQAAAEEDSFEKRSLGGSCDNAKTLRGTLSPNAGLVAETNFRR